MSRERTELDKYPAARRQKAMAGVVLALALALLIVGARRTHWVMPDPTPKAAPQVTIIQPELVDPYIGAPPPFLPPPSAMPSQHALSDLRMVEAATFTGVIRKDGQLFLTYDPTAQRGKQSCPT